MRPDRLPCTVAAKMDRAGVARRVTSEPLDASEPEHLWLVFELSGFLIGGPTAIITNPPHNTDEACAIVRNLVALVEGQRVDFVAALFRSIGGGARTIGLSQPAVVLRRNPLLLASSVDPLERGSPMHAYAWYIWRKTPRSGPSLKVRLGRDELIAVRGEVAGRTPAPLVAASDFRAPAVASV